MTSRDLLKEVAGRFCRTRMRSMRETVSQQTVGQLPTPTPTLGLAKGPDTRNSLRDVENKKDSTGREMELAGEGLDHV